MADSADDSYHLVLGKVPEEEQPAAAFFLSGCFSLPPASTKGIAASAPIVLLSDLTRAQAEAVLAELEPSLPKNVVLRVAGSDDPEKASRLQWPRPPRIYGKELAEFIPAAENHELQCPLCGGQLKVHLENGRLKASAANAPDKHSTRRIVPADDKDPLFSGIKPLATAASSYASIRSLQAGDTGFWMDYSQEKAASPAPFPDSRSADDSTHAKRSTGKIAAGLAAFMRPGVFAVVVGRTRDPQAVKIIAEVMGTTEDEARDRCLNLGLCVARDISLDEAQNLLARFRNLGAKARIVKPM